MIGDREYHTYLCDAISLTTPDQFISKMSIVCGRLFVSVTDTTDPQTEKY